MLLILLLLLWPALSAAQMTQGTPLQYYVLEGTSCIVNQLTMREGQFCLENNDQDQYRCAAPVGGVSDLHCDEPDDWQFVSPGAGSLATNDSTVNEVTDPVHWTKIQGIPPTLADGSDDGGVEGSGTVTSVTVATPAEFPVSGNPIVGAGTITIGEATQAANTFYSGSSSGGVATPNFRVLVDADVPNDITLSNYCALASCTMTGPLITTTVTTTGPLAGQITLEETDANGSNFVRLKAPDDRTTDMTFVYPMTDPLAGQVMTFSAPSGGVSTATWATPGVASGDIESVGTCGSGPCFQAEAQNLVLASPNGSTGQISPRVLVSADLPIVPVTKGGTGLTAGNSGGVLYFSTTSSLASSAALTAGMPVIGGGAGAAPTTGTRSGNTTEFATITGTKTVNKQLAFDASGNVIASASDIGEGGTASAEALRRTCMIQIGNGTDAILTADFSPFKQGRCYVPYAATLLEITVQGDTGSATLVLQRRRDASTLADLITGGSIVSNGTTEVCARSLTTQTCFNGSTSSGSTTVTNTALLSGDWIEIKSGVGNLTTALSVAVVFSVN